MSNYGLKELKIEGLKLEFVCHLFRQWVDEEADRY